MSKKINFIDWESITTIEEVKKMLLKRRKLEEEIIKLDRLAVLRYEVETIENNLYE